MTDKEIIKKIKSLADKMYDAAFNLTTDASLLRKAMDDYHQFIINEYHKEEPVSEFLNTESMIESYKQRLISQANGMNNSPLIDMCLASYKHGINETLDTLNLSNVERTEKNRKEEPVSEDLEEAIEKSFVYHDSRGDDFRSDKQIEIAYRQGFETGVNWQKEQMIANNTTDAMIGLPYENKDGGYTHLIDVSRPLPVGNNKIAIIFKED